MTNNDDNRAEQTQQPNPYDLTGLGVAPKIQEVVESLVGTEVMLLLATGNMVKGLHSLITVLDEVMEDQGEQEDETLADAWRDFKGAIGGLVGGTVRPAVARGAEMMRERMKVLEGMRVEAGVKP